MGTEPRPAVAEAATTAGPVLELVTANPTADN